MIKKILILIFILLNSNIFALTNTELDKKYKDILLEIENKDDINELEKLEETKTLQSIYSFAEEISNDESSVYEPKWTEWIKNNRKFAGDNPDTQYFTAFIDPNADYNISGTMNGLYFLEITSYRKEKGVNKISKSIILKNKEDYSINLSMNKNSKPDLILNKNDYLIMVRYYRLDPKLIKVAPVIETLTEPTINKKVDLGFRNKIALELFESLYYSSEFLTKQLSNKSNEYLDVIETTNPYASNLFPNTSVIYDGAFIDLPKDYYISIKGKIDIKKYFIFLF